MTKPKPKKLTPAEQWREELESGDYCYRYGMPDGRRLAIPGDGRDFARKALSQTLTTWEEIWTWGKPDGKQFVSRGASGNRTLLAAFNLPDLERELSPKHFALVRTLYEALKEQSIVASYAVGVAEIELGIHAKRSEGGKKTAKALKREAAKQFETFRTEAEKIRSPRSRMSDRDLARRLSERQGIGGTQANRKKLSRLLK